MTGQVRTRQRLDYESHRVVSLSIIASDRGSPRQQSTLQLTINIQDVNDNPPIFDRPSYDFSVVESIPINTNFARVNATDRDSGSNAAIVYVLGSHADIFGINPTNGQLYSRTALTDVAQRVYEVQVIAVDNGALSAITTATITIRDGSYNRPVFTEEQYRFV